MTSAAEVRDALVVATAEYSDPKLQRLRAPAVDAERLAGVLGNPEIGGFDVDVALNAQERELRRRLARFFADRRPNDLLFLHLSCHGIKDPHGDLYLAAADTEVDLLSGTGVPAAWLNEQLDRTRSKRTVVLLDCCFSGSFPLGVRARAGGDVSVREQFEGHGRGLAVITASSAMEYAYEGDDLSGAGQPSFFTEAVVQALESGEADRDQDHLISVQELYEYVYDRVKEKTPSQTPNIKSELQGPLYIARSKYRPPVVPAKLDDSILEAMESPLRRVREGAVAELAVLANSSRAGVALAACQALEQMVDDDSRQVSAGAQVALKAARRDPEGPPSEKARPLDRLETVSREKEKSPSEPEAPPGPEAPPAEPGRPPQADAASREGPTSPSEPASSKGRPKPERGPEAASKEMLRPPPEPEARSGGLATKHRKSIRRRLALAGGAAATLVVAVIALLADGSDQRDGSGAQQQAGGAARGRISTQAQGEALIARQEGKTQILVTASDLKPSTQNTAYQVWLSNSEQDRRSLGATVTDERGNLEAGAELPANFEDYEFIDMTSVTVRGQGQDQSFKTGPTVLRGAIDLRDQPVTRGSGRSQTTLLGEVRLRPLPD